MKPLNKLLLDDKSRFIAVLCLLSEKFVDSLVNDYLYNAYYPTEFNKVLRAYGEHKKELLAAFSNPKIKVAYQQLNKIFDVLEKFLTFHFYIPQSHYEGRKKQPPFYLEPRIHHNFRLSEGGKKKDKEKDSKEWDEYKNELDKLAYDFKKSYKNFVNIAKKELGETVKEKFGSQKTNKPNKKLTTLLIPDKYKISVKDREIWVNEYLIGKPHSVGSNFEFFDYIRSKQSHTLIERNKMPNVGDGIGYGYTKKAIGKKSFIKILNNLGFKGEILKAFFYKRSKDTLIYRGDEITKEDLEKAGVKTSLFLKELELAHIKNSPE